jgi:hypothetical protein
MHLALIAAAAGALATATSEEPPAPIRRENVILFQPEPGGMALAYTRALSESWAVTASLGVNANVSEMLGAVGTVSTNLGADLDLGLTRYLISRAPAGPWVRMRMGAGYQRFTFAPMVPDAEPLQGQSSTLRGAVLLGFTAILEPGFTIPLAAGPEVLRFFQQVEHLTGPASLLGWSLQARTELGVGWSF